MAHPGAELYGSDRVFLESVSGLVDDGWRVVVTVPADGPPHPRPMWAAVLFVDASIASGRPHVEMDSKPSADNSPKVANDQIPLATAAVLFVVDQYETSQTSRALQLTASRR